MYAGHFAAALAIKAKEPRAPTWALLLGVGFLDVLFGIFLMLGIERARITPGISPGFSLDFIDTAVRTVHRIQNLGCEFESPGMAPLCRALRD